MNHRTLPLLLTAFILCVTTATASSLKDAYKALTRVRAYDAQGTLLREGTGCFLDEQGTLLTAYDLLVGASRIDAVDVRGKVFALSRITGAKADAGMVTFTTTGEGKNARPSGWLPLATTPAADNATLYLLTYETTKKAVPAPVKVTRTEPFGDYRYYYTDAANDLVAQTPLLLNEAGELVAMLQRNVGKGAQTACAADARIVSSLTITPTSALDADLRKLQFPKALPATPNDASSYLYMLAATDSARYLTACDDYIARWPERADGYTTRGDRYAGLGRWSDAEADYATALRKAEADTTVITPDAVTYSFANLIYSTLTQRNDTAAPAPGWTIERAQDEAHKAYSLRPLPLYRMLEAKCHFARRDYKQAYELFLEASREKGFDTPEVFYAAARSLALSGGDSLKVLTLLDSCIAALPAGAPRAVDAGYYWDRARLGYSLGRYRQAVADYDRYEQAVGPSRLNDRFYYLRARVEIEAKMYQQALSDLQTAIATTSKPAPYYLEQAYMLLQIGEYPRAIEAAEEVKRLEPENADAYRIIGIAQGEQGQKAKARAALEQAKRLGDDSVDALIKRYQ